VELHIIYFKSRGTHRSQAANRAFTKEERNNKTPKPSYSNTAGAAKSEDKTPGLSPIRRMLQNHAIMAAAGVLNNRFRLRSHKLIQDFISKVHDFSNGKGPVDDEPLDS